MSFDDCGYSEANYSELDFEYTGTEVSPTLEEGLATAWIGLAIPDVRENEDMNDLKEVFKKSFFIVSSGFSELPIHNDAFSPDGWHKDFSYHLPIIPKPISILYPPAPAANQVPSKWVVSKNIDKKTEGFIASPKLMEIWWKGYSSQPEVNKKMNVADDNILENSKYYREIERSIDKVISNFARFKSYEKQDHYRITFNGQILSYIEGLIADNLFLPPRPAVEFLNLLTKEIYDQTSNSKVFYGNWGELVVDDDGELVLHLAKRKPKKLSKVLQG